VKESWVNQLTPGQTINDSFVLRKLDIREYGGKKYLSLEFGDKTGRIGGVCWENAQEYIQDISIGNIIRVAGTVGTYRDVPQINVISMESLRDGDYDPSDFLPTGLRSPEEMLAEIDKIINSIRDFHYKALLSEIFNDGILRRKFSYAPAAKLWHHSYIGGLAEHSLNVAYLCRAACELYDDLNHDLLITGALLHDVGKADTYSLDNFFDYTDEGRLTGHIVIADRIISRKIDRLGDFPVEKKRLVRHLVLSHHDAYEKASPVLPQTLEANVLSIADLLDSRVGGILKVKAKTRQPGQRWSNYVKLLERFIYFDDKQGED